MIDENRSQMIDQKLPNGTAVLVLGIISIITVCCYGIVSIITGGIGLYLAKKDGALHKTNPGMYSNFSTLNTGKILCIIGLILGVLYLGLVIAMFAMFGLEGMQDQDLMRERIEGMFGQ